MHIPILVLHGFEFYPWQLGSLIRMMRGKVADADLIRAEFFGYQIDLERHYRYTIDEASVWERFYAPIPLKDKTVLDVGAGCGETAAFFFSKGASKVVAVEPNPQAVKLLEANARGNSWKLDTIFDSFKLEHLSIPHDFLKVDCEGGETNLLEYTGPSLGPCVIEVHSPRIAKDLMAKFHFDSVATPSERHPGTKLLISPG
jgi:SAM-dependent methyltransferase